MKCLGKYLSHKKDDVSEHFRSLLTGKVNLLHQSTSTVRTMKSTM
jgi:hypothetical protein